MTTMQIVKAARKFDNAPVMITREEILSLRHTAPAALNLLPGEAAALIEWIKTF